MRLLGIRCLLSRMAVFTASRQGRLGIFFDRETRSSRESTLPAEVRKPTLALMAIGIFESSANGQDIWFMTARATAQRQLPRANRR